MADDDWVKSALMDDFLVVELLSRLKNSPADPFYSQSWIPTRVPKPVLPPLGWGHRQLRSKPVTVKDREPTRCSPTTPLSWSANSLSDGYDDCIAGRSKGTFANDTATATTSKKSRKKKTFTELKDEESFLLKERVYLEKELASLHVTLNEQRSRGDNLKKIKLDYQVQAPNNMLPISDNPASVIFSQFYKAEASTIDQAHSIFPRHAINNDQPSCDSKKVQQVFDSQERGFVLPDLNMMPSEEEPCEILNGMR